MKLFNRIVKPILNHARCTLDVTCKLVQETRIKYFNFYLIPIVTTHRRHATEIVKEIPLDYDAIVIVSGDGLAHEILNGFAEHENPRAAFAIPLAPVPTGSGNGCCISLLGLKVTANSSSYEKPYR